ncbi:unnamed protein product [Dibothriocephalus latus]|uniref:Uncharacterized protein n=1 Tax=Dibothriocephalus latus TaxID=60516 RepID=A0A3P7NUD9_DIBLA|nr:unnamed protein product [Dibothriocephalus latus]
MCISMPWDLSECTKSLESGLNWLLFNRQLTSSLLKIVKRNADMLSGKYDVPKILRVSLGYFPLCVVYLAVMPVQNNMY